MNLRELQQKVWKEYVENGYSDFWNVAMDFKARKKENIAELGMITTEISEATETVFKSSGGLRREEEEKKLGLECADIIIRTLNFMSKMHMNAEDYILAKNEANLKRGYLHGKTE